MIQLNDLDFYFFSHTKWGEGIEGTAWNYKSYDWMCLIVNADGFQLVLLHIFLSLLKCTITMDCKSSLCTQAFKCNFTD